LLILRGRIFDFAVSLTIGLTLAAWLQANFLNVDYGVLNGLTINWQNYTKLAVTNTAIWLAVIALPVVVRLIGRRLWNVLAWAVPAAVIVAAGAALVSTYYEADLPTG
jgi:hypothetical protein